MAVSTFFHRNVFLLNQLIPPNDDFKKVFREGMFDKPNIAGFLQVSHYLLTICDAERYRKLVEWPIICKQMEVKYRNDVRDYLNIISLENPDMGFPRILTTYLHHASGTKFMIIMWKLSQLAMRRYIIRKGDHEVILTPKLGPATDLVKTYLQQSKANLASNISSHHRNSLQMEKIANFALVEEKENLDKIKAELFDKKHSVKKCATTAPVADSIKQRLTNIEDLEIIQMWKNNLDQNMCYIRKKNTILKNLEAVCENINGIISNLLNDAKVLNGKQLEEINCSLISELSFLPNAQHCLVYNDNKLVYHNFTYLLTLILGQLYQYLRKNDLQLVDLSQCFLQIEASVEDMKSVQNVFKTFLTNMIDSTKETQNILCEKNVGYISQENVLPLIKSVLLMPSPLIRINTNYADEKNDLYKLLQFTPGEVTHKSLFSRYTRHNRNRTPDLRTNLFVSRINVDDILSSNNERQDISMRFATPKLYKKPTGKYSRLFSTHRNKNLKANSSMCLPFTARANSSTVTSTARKMINLSDLNITARSFFNLSQESFTPIKLTPIKSDTLQDTSKETKDVINREFKVNKSDLNELTEVQLINYENKSTIIKHENASRRRSIGDLVERYKKVLEVSKHTTVKFQNECSEYEIE